MMDLETVRSIISTYEKYDWVLRRVLSAPASEEILNEVAGELPVLAADIDAAWFSRPPKTGAVTWELRYLGEPALALLIKADESGPEFEEALREVEARLSDTLLARSKGLTST
jgi:hypothetical protein